MNKTDLLELLKNGESSTVEFKSAVFHNDSLAKEIVALANMSGGLVLIGVADDGTIKGIDDKSVEARAVSICRNNIVPPIIPETAFVDVGGKKVLFLSIEKGPYKPYKVKASNKYYIRAGSISIEPTNEELIRLFQNGAQLHFEASHLPGTGPDDVDTIKFKAYCTDFRNIEWDDSADQNKLLYNFQIIDENRRLTVAGALFFAGQVTRWLPQAGIEMHCFAGCDRIGDIVDFKSPDNDVPTLIQTAEQFVAFNSRTRATFNPEETRRTDRPDYPPFAVRELVANAFMHRDWSIFGQKIRLDIFSDRLEVFSPGRIPNTLNLQRALSGISYYRNPLIAQMLKDYGLAEKAGRGLLKIMKHQEKMQLRPPEFDLTEAYFKVTLYNANQGIVGK